MVNIIRIGTCGVLQPDVHLEDRVLPIGAVRLENASTFLVDGGYPAVASYEVILALIMGSESVETKYHIGLTASASDLYGAQGREIPVLSLRYPDLQAQLTLRRVSNFEMESSTPFTLCTLKGVRASTICAAIAERTRGALITPERERIAETTCIRAGPEAFRFLSKPDEQKSAAGKSYWFPVDIIIM